jgi:hypothetical protein
MKCRQSFLRRKGRQNRPRPARYFDLQSGAGGERPKLLPADGNPSMFAGKKESDWPLRPDRPTIFWFASDADLQQKP